jgi:Leucine-rich repeat (LRR) protein
VATLGFMHIVYYNFFQNKKISQLSPEANTATQRTYNQGMTALNMPPSVNTISSQPGTKTPPTVPSTIEELYKKHENSGLLDFFGIKKEATLENWISCVKNMNSNQKIPKTLANIFESEIKTPNANKIIALNKFLDGLHNHSLKLICVAMDPNTKNIDETQAAETFAKILNEKKDSIVKLNLRFAPLFYLPPEIGNLTNLTHLYLPITDLTTLPKEIGNLVNLKELDLSGNYLTTVPKEIGNLRNLTKLNLSGNSLTTLPEEITNLTGLEEFDLMSNYLTTVPKEMGNLKNLTKLNLSGNSLTTLPEEIRNFKNLNVLNLNSNNPKKLRTLQHSKCSISGVTH